MAPVVKNAYQKLKTGDIVTLRDETTIAELMEDGVGNAMDGMDLEVQNVRHVEIQGCADFYFCDLGGQPPHQPPLVLVVKIVDSFVDHRIYWLPDDVPTGSRIDLLDADCHWLFEEPDDPEQFDVADLRFAAQVIQHNDDLGEVHFVAKGSEIHGEHRELEPSSTIAQPATIVEWLAETDVEHPELMALEVGGLDRFGQRLPEGGYVILMQGKSVPSADVKLLIR